MTTPKIRVRALPRGLAAVHMAPFTVVNARLTQARQDEALRFLLAKMRTDKPLTVVRLAELGVA